MTGESTDPNGSDTARNTDEMFVAESDSPRLIKRLDLLEVGAVPEGDRIVSRDNEIESLVSNLRPIVRGEPPTPVLISGKTGTGKSLVARHVAKTATNVAEREGLDVADIYVDCSQHSTETRAVCATARSINKTAGSPQDIPLTGLGASQYYTYIWELLEDFDAAVVILDEIDRIQPDNDGNQDDILMQLSRAREAQKTDTNIGIIAISNKLDYPEEMNQRVRSSFGDAELLFPPYDANQLKDIMRAREDAFYDDALESGVIPKAAALAAREHGDARKRFGS
jgi:orc1/cdc6 family replication initiation protein